jgi:RNA polymerase sigma-70 factor (ECF subfamily)
MKPVDKPPAPEETARMKAAALAVPAVLPRTDCPRPADRDTGELRRLTAAVRRGDEAAFTELYDRHSLRLYRHILALTRGDEPAAREIFQTVALKLARKMEVFDDEARLRAWLATLARHEFLDHRRARVRRERRTAPLPDGLAATEAAPAGWAEPLARALGELAPDDRELLQAAYTDGRPLAELAATRGETYKAVESRLARLRQKTKSALLKILRHEDAP